MAENFDLDRFFKSVVSAKASAKSARDDHAYEEAIDILEEWIERVRRAKEEVAPRAGARMDAQLADLYGLVGGTQRRWGLESQDAACVSHLGDSVDAYDQGFRYESTLDAKDATTYNRINRLVGRVLLDPSVLQPVGADPVKIDVTDELVKAEQILIGQIESGRQGDPWAYCDLATVRLLRGSEDALTTLKKIVDLRPLKFVYDSTLATLEPLAQVASGVRPDLAIAVTEMRRVAER